MAYHHTIELLRNDTAGVAIVLDQEILSDGSQVYNVLILGDCGRVKVEIAATDYDAAVKLYNQLTDLRVVSSIDVDSIR